MNHTTIRTSLAASALVAFCAGATPARLTAAGAAVGIPQQENTSVRESEATGRVRTLDTATRVITVVTPKNVGHQVYVPEDVKAFTTLAVGDDVTVRFTDSTIVRANRQAQPARLSDTTAQAREEAQKQGADTHIVQQLKLVVRIDGINRQAGEVMYRTADDMYGLQRVSDLKLLDGINPGDTVEIIYTRARAVSVAQATKR